MPGRDLGEYRKQHSLVWEEHSGWREMQIQCPEVCRISARGGRAKGQDGWNGASANASQYLATGVREADEVCLGHDVHFGLFLCGPNKATEKQVLSREGYGLINSF